MLCVQMLFLGSENTVLIGWQFTSYQAAEESLTVQACAQVLNGAANIGTRAITLQVLENSDTATGKYVGNKEINTYQVNNRII